MVNQSLLEIISEVCKRGINAQLGWDSKGEQLQYIVSGFSKCGSVIINEKEGHILVHQRYNQVNEITNFEELARIAWGWYLDYKDREPFTEPDSNWVSTFVEFGFLKVETFEVTKYTIR